ncbi:uncharacterized protein LTR77_011255 [Saxophila tyrrhenica]|uniref:Uncharacterized protein n=1 Tax=Saxophila tyrrhenica TaxID=1690608 RepID=A0AAV9NTA8_9PEZI|nr:hypothetical protein LTR77_011255 [Saxophila tyrrhenica]
MIQRAHKSLRNYSTKLAGSGRYAVDCKRKRAGKTSPGTVHVSPLREDHTLKAPRHEPMKVVELAPEVEKNWHITYSTKSLPEERCQYTKPIPQNSAVRVTKLGAWMGLRPMVSTRSTDNQQNDVANGDLVRVEVHIIGRGIANALRMAELLRHSSQKAISMKNQDPAVPSRNPLQELLHPRCDDGFCTYGLLLFHVAYAITLEVGQSIRASAGDVIISSPSE